MPVLSTLRCMLCDKDDCSYAPIATLNCGHAMCTSCLSVLSRIQYNLVASRCPLCRRNIDYSTVRLRGDHTPIRTRKVVQRTNAPWNDRYGCDEARRAYELRQQSLQQDQEERQSVTLALNFEE